MAGLLTVMLVTSLALTYAELVTSANESAALRLERATDQLGSLAVTSTGLIRSRLDSVAGERTLRSALELPHEDTAAMPPAASATLDSARATLDDMLSANDTGLTVELWSEDGRRVAYAGRDLSALSVQSQAPESGHPLVLLG